jgi:acyl-coenzyme A thioesterase PaaI-like protein
MAMPGVEEWRRRNDAHPLHRALGVRADEIGEGFTQYRVTVTPASAGGLDGPATVGSADETAGAQARVSTFAITTAADLALVSAVSTTVTRTRDTMNGTAELNLTYVRLPEGEALVRATVLHRGRTEAVIDIRVTDERGEVVAYGRGTYSIRPEPGGIAR